MHLSLGDCGRFQLRTFVTIEAGDFLKQQQLFENICGFFSNNKCYTRILADYSQTTNVIREFFRIFLKQQSLYENFKISRDKSK